LTAFYLLTPHINKPGIMPEYKGHCHCGEVAWTAEIPEERHVLCYCGACKAQSGGEFTLNQIIPKDNFNLTKGDLKVYTYKGDSGKSAFGRHAKQFDANRKLMLNI
jgi:hypothetical protein